MPLLIDVPRTPQGADGARPAEAASSTPAVPAGQGDFLRVIVHELRQPLTVIRGQLQLGRRQIGIDDGRIQVAMDLAIAQVDRMAKLLDALLAARAGTAMEPRSSTTCSATRASTAPRRRRSRSP